MRKRKVKEDQKRPPERIRNGSGARHTRAAQPLQYIPTLRIRFMRIKGLTFAKTLDRTDKYNVDVSFWGPSKAAKNLENQKILETPILTPKQPPNLN